ncbi:MAG: threonine/serine exporter family protein [Ruminococcaceae bacterium]|nr:threonine/serine exporter family protein [Oscillospiraceae bacterium]
MTSSGVSRYDNGELPAQILRTAGEAARMTLQYGGGANRAEDVYCRICSAFGEDDAQISAVSTNLSVALSVDGQSYSTVFRIKRRGVNLSKLNSINDVSRALTSGTMTLAQAEEALRKIENSPANSDIVNVAASGFSSAFFSLLLGGGVWDFSLTFMIGALICYILSFFEKAGVYSFVNNLLGGLVDAGAAILVSLAVTPIGLETNLEAVIVGAMMPLLPGLAMTNAIRDTISGDYVSGTASVMEALSMAIALAAGAAVGFGIFMSQGVVL